MKTDYKNLTGIETLAVIFAVVGIVLIGSMVIGSLDESARQDLAAAVQVLDIHTPVAYDFNNLGQAYGYYDEFLQKFYVAFTELLTIPEQDIAQAKQLAIHGKSAYQKLLALHPPERGRVLGKSIRTEEKPILIPEIKIYKLNNLQIK